MLTLLIATAEVAFVDVDSSSIGKSDRDISNGPAAVIKRNFFESTVTVHKLSIC